MESPKRRWDLDTEIVLFLVATTAVKRLDKWSRQMCDVHNSLIRGKTPCVCEPPFKLFAFPTIKKNSEARKRWIKLRKRQDLRGKPWEPKPSLRVCRAHFVSGKPKDENPDPVLELGYKSPVSSSRKRTLPTERPVPLKRSRKSETRETGEILLLKATSS